MTLNKKEKNRLLLVLSLLAAIGPLSTDMYLPGFQIIALDLNTTIPRVGLSLTTYFFGLTLGQLFYGPLVDRFGRRKPLFIGLTLYTISTILCAFSPTVDWLILSRLFLALGGCVGMVVSRAIVRDFFDVEESARFLSTLMLIMGLAPIVAPLIGSAILIYFGWHFIFLSLLLYALVLLTGLFCFLPPTRGEDISVKVSIKEVFKSYFMILREPTFLAFGLAGAITGASLFAYISGSPFVYMEIFGLSEQQYSWAFGINATGLMIGSQVNRLLLKKYSSKRITGYALVALSAIITILLIGVEFSIFTPFLSMAFIFLFIVMLGGLNPNTTALALSPFAKEAGRASALMGSIQMGTSALVSAVVSSLLSDSALPMLACMAFCAFGGLIIVSSRFLVRSS
jgi:DHA1 family bicyclomycin/chloramphenicol resistance-like MFS transporter